MYRVNYRQLIGTYKDQRLFYMSSFLSPNEYKTGDKVHRDEVCAEVEVVQCLRTTNV